MKMQLIVRVLVLTPCVWIAVTQFSAAQYAAEVISYDVGTSAAPGFGDPLAALGPPERLTGDGGSFPGVVSPFNPPFLTSEIISVGEGGQLTLRLQNYAVPQTAGSEIGVFVNVGLADADFPNGFFDAPYTIFGVDRAMVEVSEQGTTWTSLGEFEFNVPTNGYADAAGPFQAMPGVVDADFQQPFAGALADFEDLRYADGGMANMLDLLAGSGGGNWLDISAAGLARVGYVRFSVADDGDANTELNFELDAVSVAHGSVGPAVSEPSGFLLLVGTVGGLATRRSLASRRRGA